MAEGSVLRLPLDVAIDATIRVGAPPVTPPVEDEPNAADLDCPCLANGRCAGNHADVSALTARIQTLQQEALGTDQIRKFLADLDRCPHGRHKGDTCAGWYGPGPRDGGCQGGVSQGNPHMAPGAIIGYGLGADPIRVPADRQLKHDANNWYDKTSRVTDRARGQRVKDAREIIERERA